MNVSDFSIIDFSTELEIELDGFDAGRVEELLSMMFMERFGEALTNRLSEEDQQKLMELSNGSNLQQIPIFLKDKNIDVFEVQETELQKMKYEVGIDKQRFVDHLKYILQNSDDTDK